MCKGPEVGLSLPILGTGRVSVAGAQEGDVGAGHGEGQRDGQRPGHRGPWRLWVRNVVFTLQDMKNPRQGFQQGSLVTSSLWLQ